MGRPPGDRSPAVACLRTGRALRVPRARVGARGKQFGEFALDGDEAWAVSLAIYSAGPAAAEGGP